jgi:hypothetical protein
MTCTSRHISSALILGVVGVMLVVFLAQAAEQTIGRDTGQFQWGATVNNVSVSALLARSSYRTNSPIEVIVAMKNVGATALEMQYTQSPISCFRVSNQSRSLVAPRPNTRYGVSWSAGAGLFALKPGQVAPESIDLNYAYRLSPGRFYLTYQREVRTLRGLLLGAPKSRTLSFVVQ